MKKLLLTFVLITGVILISNAQGVDFGLKAGLNMAKLSGDVEQADLKAGLHAGVFLNLKLNDNFAISPEALFSQQGAKSDIGSLNLNYVNVPILAKIGFAKVLNLHLGPQFGFLMSAKIKDFDVKEDYKSLDLSAVAGLGLDLPMGITGGARYNLGLGSIDDGDNKTTNQYFQVYIGYKLF